jgi:hypothetical protein
LFAGADSRGTEYWVMVSVQPVGDDSRDDAPTPKRWVAVKGVRRAVGPNGRATEAAPAVPEPVYAPIRLIADPAPGPDRRERPTRGASIRLPGRTRALRLVLTNANGRRRWAVDVLVRQSDAAVVRRG